MAGASIGIGQPGRWALTTPERPVMLRLQPPDESHSPSQHGAHGYQRPGTRPRSTPFAYVPCLSEVYRDPAWSRQDHRWGFAQRTCRARCRSRCRKRSDGRVETTRSRAQTPRQRGTPADKQRQDTNQPLAATLDVEVLAASRCEQSHTTETEHNRPRRAVGGWDATEPARRRHVGRLSSTSDTEQTARLRECS